jgi:hypothetical protein
VTKDSFNAYGYTFQCLLKVTSTGMRTGTSLPSGSLAGLNPRLHYVDCSTIKGGVETIDQANLVSLSLDRDQNSQKDLSFRAAASLPHWVFWSSERVEDAVRAYRELDKLRISIVKATGVCERVDCASIYCGFVVWGYE